MSLVKRKYYLWDENSHIRVITCDNEWFITIWSILGKFSKAFYFYAFPSFGLHLGCAVSFKMSLLVIAAFCVIVLQSKLSRYLKNVLMLPNIAKLGRQLHINFKFFNVIIKTLLEAYSIIIDHTPTGGAQLPASSN